MKIQIIGGSGTGKSTLAKYISEKEKIKWIDTVRIITFGRMRRLQKITRLKNVWKCIKKI